MMNDRALRVLEFSKIQARLAEFALTGMGRERCLALRPQETLTQAQEALEETEEAQVILTYLGGSPLIEFSDVRPSLTMAEKGASLFPRALLDIARSLTAARAARSALVTERENTPRVTGLASHLQTFRQLETADRQLGHLLNGRRRKNDQMIITVASASGGLEVIGL